MVAIAVPHDFGIVVAIAVPHDFGIVVAIAVPSTHMTLALWWP